MSTRIYHPILPQLVTYPAIAFRRASLNQEDNIDSSAGVKSSPGMAQHRFRVFSTAKGATATDDAEALDEKVRLALQGYKGTVSNGGDSLVIDGIFPRFSFDFYDDPTQTHQVISDFEVWAEQPRPT